ncbi:MAG TPA: ferrochelatase [Rhizomicrobium sp.]|nr:ferrochelatase [Rhizomicrobium sp.]
MKIAVVLFNLGGPDSLESVELFLRNLFSDPAILPLPEWLRRPVAWMIAKRRAPVAQAIYREIGGRSPLLQETSAQATALEQALARRGAAARTFIAMRAWKPMSDETVRSVLAYEPALVVLLPLYPQYSTATSGSSLLAWQQASRRGGLAVPHKRVCCYPWGSGFIAALKELLEDALSRRKPGLSYRVLFSAHGLPQRTISGGDPYQWQVERTVDAILRSHGAGDLDWRISYQSRVGPLQWLEPATDAEIRQAGAEGKGLVVMPVAFVSEHSETLVELDIEYARLAKEAGVPDYIRVATAGTSERFIDGLADLVLKATTAAEPITCGNGRICPEHLGRCGLGGAQA